MNFEAKPQSLLTFRVGPVLCCAPSLPVRSIITPPKLTHPPGSDSSQPGIFKHGSHIVKVLDLRHKFGVEKAEQTQPGNFIITIFEKEGFAFWVDQILDVFDFPTEGWGNLPAAIPRGVFSRTLLLNNKIHLYSEFEKLAIINDLGYLKHYIQQLKLQSTPETTIAEKKKTAISTFSKKPEITTSKKVAAITSSTEHKEEDKHKSVSDSKMINSGNDKPAEKTISPVIHKAHAVTKLKTPSTIKPVVSPTASTAKTVPEPRPVKPAPRTHLNNTRSTSNIGKNIVSPSSIATPPAKQSTQDDNESSALGIILFFILLLGAMGSGIYYLFLEDTTRDYKYKKEEIYASAKPNYEKELTYDNNETGVSKTDSTSDKFDSTSIESEEIAVTNEDNMDLPEEKIEVKTIEKEELTSAQIIEDEGSNVSKPDVLIKKVPAAPLFNAEPDPIDNLAYRAEITKLDNEITITLHQSFLDEKLQPAEATIPLETIEQTKIDQTITGSPPVKKLKQEELKIDVATKKIIKEIVHIVVKGDTLWAIAKKYVNNPFLYPELARLSNIKNPHRIYPGNRVRIRFVKN